MEIFLPALAILVSFGLFVTFIFSKRYGRPIAIKAVVSIFVLSFLIAFISFRVLSKDVEKSIDPAIVWQKVPLEYSVSELRYIRPSGLFAKTPVGKLQLTQKTPFCVKAGEVENSHPIKIEIEDPPNSEIPAFSQPVKQQLSFHMSYSVYADQGGFSSFVLDQDGQVWCSERLINYGMTGAVVLGVAIYIYLVIAAAIFVISLVIGIVSVVVGLEIYRWRHKPIQL